MDMFGGSRLNPAASFDFVIYAMAWFMAAFLLVTMPLFVASLWRVPPFFPRPEWRSPPGLAPRDLLGGHEASLLPDGRGLVLWNDQKPHTVIRAGRFRVGWARLVADLRLQGVNEAVPGEAQLAPAPAIDAAMLAPKERREFRNLIAVHLTLAWLLMILAAMPHPYMAIETTALLWVGMFAAMMGIALLHRAYGLRLSDTLVGRARAAQGA
jgi:hypothetical protein